MASIRCDLFPYFSPLIPLLRAVETITMAALSPNMTARKSVTVEESGAFAPHPNDEAIKPELAEVAVLTDRLDDPDAGKPEEEKQALDKKILWKCDLASIPWLWYGPCSSSQIQAR
jgi:hypothetical protein